MFRPQHRVCPGNRLLAASFSGLAIAAVAGLAVLRVAGSGPVAAQSNDGLPGTVPKAPPYVSGFPMPFFRTSDYRDRMGSVVAADLEGDGRAELVVSVPSGLITVVGTSGVRRPGWPRTFESLPQPAFPSGEPAVGDLDGDGVAEIVACVVSGGAERRVFLVALRADGTDLPGWPVEAPGGPAGCPPGGVLLADLDGDGRPEVLRAFGGGTVVARRADGSPLDGWPARLGPDAQGRTREINAELAAGDLDGDGAREVILLESGLRPRLAAVGRNGDPMPGFPLTLGEVTDRQAPVAADLDGDGRAEVVASTLPFSGEIDPGGGEPTAAAPLDEGAGEGTADETSAVPGVLRVLRADGSMAAGWPRTLDEGGPWGPIVADILGDARPEILQQDGDRLLGFDAAGDVLPGFPHTLHRQFLRSQWLEISPWVVADLDGDTRPDLLQVHSNLYSGQAYLRVFGLHVGGRSLRGFPFDAEGMLRASRPVVADLSGDGIGDLALLVTDGGNGPWILVAWDLGSLVRGR
jgi:hypothetical protein